MKKSKVSWAFLNTYTACDGYQGMLVVLSASIARLAGAVGSPWPTCTFATIQTGEVLATLLWWEWPPGRKEKERNGGRTNYKEEA